MNFTLPQFIEMESKVVGPMTFRQFVFVAVGTVLSFFIYVLMNKTAMAAAVALIAITESAACALAFVKIDGIGLATFLINAFKFSAAPRMFLWKNYGSPRNVVMSQEEVTIQKAPLGKKVNLTAKKASLKRMQNYMETKGR